MPLVDPSTELPLDQLLGLRQNLVEELKELPTALADAPGASAPASARGGTARQLVADALLWVEGAPVPTERRQLVAEINLLYDVTIVAAEYYKLFIRPPTPARPSGRI